MWDKNFKTCEFANIISNFFRLWGFRSALVTSLNRCLTFFPNILFSDIFLGGLLEWSLLSEKLLLASSSAWHLMTRRPFMKLVVHVFFFLYSQMDFGFNIFQEPFPGIFDQFFISCGIQIKCRCWIHIKIYVSTSKMVGRRKFFGAD